MGISRGACFRILGCTTACGSSTPRAAAAKADNAPVKEKKADKQRFRFWNKSTKHRFNNVIAGTFCLGCTEESLDVATNNYCIPKYSSVQEKLIEKKANKATKLPSSEVNPAINSPPVTKEHRTLIDLICQERAATVIQAAIRKCMAKREFQRLKSIVAIQAAARAHLVRSRAIRMLRCALAIVKMQRLVRARLVRQSAGKTAIQEDEVSVVTKLVRGSACTELKRTNSTTKKLLSNIFARQRKRRPCSNNNGTKPVLFATEAHKE